MKKNWAVIIGGILVALLFVIVQCVFIVREGEAAVLTTFGKPLKTIREAGLYRRWPWPVQRVHLFDQRIHCLEGAYEQVLTQDGKNLLVALYSGWRIEDPRLFLERVGTVGQAERNLDGLIRNYKTAVFGRHPFSSLVNVNPEAIRFEEMEDTILKEVRSQAAARYGIEVVFLGIRQLGLPEAITAKVFDRMRAEREEAAEKYRSEGEAEAIKIRAAADSRRDQILAKAQADAKKIRADGDAKAAEYYRIFDKDPELAMFLRKLEVLEETLKNKATVVLSPETEPFDLLKGEQGLPKKAQ